MSNVTPLNRKITLPAMSWNLIKGLLNSPGWASTPRQIIVAGRIDAGETIKLPPLPNHKDPKRVLTREEEEKWMNKQIAIELQDKQVEVIKACVNHFISQKGVNTGKYGLAIVEAFIGED